MLMAAASRSNKSINQDAYALARNPRAQVNGIVVADGVGSHYGCEIGAQIGVAAVKDGLEALESLAVDIAHLFASARRRLADYVDTHTADFPPDLDWKNAFGTTLLCAVEAPLEIVIGYLGNGAILHLRGNFNMFPASQLLPWTVTNYLNPHSLPHDGKNLLYKLLSVHAISDEMPPAIMTVRKDLDLFGDIIMVCSDGIYSFDQTPMGRDDRNHVWISAEESVTMFFDTLSAFFAKRTYTEEALQVALEEYLVQLGSKNLVTDDCTLGVLITGEVLRYQEAVQ